MPAPGRLVQVLLVSLIAGAFAPSVFAQSPSVRGGPLSSRRSLYGTFDGARPVRVARIPALHLEEQLPTNRTKSVVQDASGRLWNGTDNGVVRFDGSAFATFRAPLRIPLVKDVYSTEDGRLLFSTDRGIHKIVRRKDTISFPLLVEGRRERTDSTVTYPKSIYQDDEGRLWIAESNAIARYEDGTLARYIPDPKLTNWSERFMRSFLFAEPSEGPLVATAQRGYAYVYSEKRDRFRRLKLPDRPTLDGIQRWTSETSGWNGPPGRRPQAVRRHEHFRNCHHGDDPDLAGDEPRPVCL